MPELPEVETVVRGLRPLLESQRLTGKTIGTIERRAKYGLIRFPEGGDTPLTLLFHLGMSGRMVCVTPPEEDFDKHDHVVFQTAKGQVRFNDPRRFGFVEMYSGPDSTSRFLDQLGPEPLSEALNPGHMRSVFKDKSAPIKASLLNQRLIAGLGNIYVCEALFEAGIRPTRATGSLKRREIERLCEEIKAVLIRAIDAGGSSLRDHRQVSGELGYFQHAWRVYGREDEPCRTCTRPVERIVQSNRSTFFCAACQR